ncbi:MAG: DNA polymerase III subunit gamma/tau [Patescibacteria group bacterium]
MSETLYRKYRPKTFADVSEQGHVKNALQNQLKSGTLGHAYLFAGPRGVGKTTMARLLAKSVNCEKLKDAEPCLKCKSCLEIERGATLDVVEIDAASHTGVDDVREMIIENIRFVPNWLKKKVFIIDEVHMLTMHAFNALLKTLEEPPPYALFILATTELHKVPETIISRCQRFDFHRLRHDVIVERLNGLVKAEKTKVENDVLEVIARRSDGCMRDAESLLAQVLAVDDPSLVLPPSYVQEAITFLEVSSTGEAVKAIKIVSDAVERGARMEPFMDEVLAQMRHSMLKSLGCQIEPRYDADVEKRLSELGKTLGAQRLQEMLRTFIEDRDLFMRDQFPQIALEIFAGRFALQDILQANGDTPMPIKSQAHGHQVITPDDTPTRGNTGDPTKIKTTLAQIRDGWVECCKGLGEHSATLPLVLQNAQVSELSGGELRLSFPFQFHAHQINESKNKRLIEDALAKTFSEPIYITAHYVPTSTEAVITDLIQEFGGSVA